MANACLDCDPDDGVGCKARLVCGVDNCGKFHQLGSATGFLLTTDCCESKWEWESVWCDFILRTH